MPMDKVAEIVDQQEALEKMKVVNQKQAKVQSELEENIMMFENVVESCDQQINALEEELRNMEETVPFYTYLCEMHK